MKKITIFTILTFLVGTTSLFAAQEIDSEKRKEIAKMLQLTGMEKLMDQMKGQIIGSFKARRPNLPESVWKSLDENFDMNELLEMIIPIYDKYYTLEDLKAVNAFYSTPAGQKILSTLPQVMQESMQVGQKWGEQVGLKVARELSRHR
jgi:uncharacterized protein